MYYVYSLQSKNNPTKFYVGMTNDIERRLKEHNSGNSTQTSRFRPWDLVTYITFTNKQKALAFEKYLKTGSGRAFAKNHF